MLRLAFAATCSLLLFCANAAAQSGGPARQACDTLLKPAYESAEEYKKQNLTADCTCVTGYLTGRYGAEDGEIIIRLFSAFSSESEEKVKATIQQIGQGKLQALLTKIGGKFQDVGREMDKACPAIKKS
jgi:Cdc6-like AAA superfamily ATPase